jgi:predicted phosphodiesterase
VGKRTAGRDHTLASQVGHLRGLLARIPGDVTATWGQAPARWIVIVGSDLLHADTYGQTTTSGTPQGAQSVGSTAQALRAAIELLAELVDQLAVSAPVLAVHVPGNHDRVLGHAVACALEQRYRNEPLVTVDAGEAPHRVIGIGRVPLMLHHGDGADASRAAATLRREAPAECDIRHAMIAHGHLHRRRAAWSDDHGTLTICMSSPATADDWHAVKHYTGSRQAIGVWRIHHSGRLPMPMWVEC